MRDDYRADFQFFLDYHQARIQELAWYQQIYEKERQRERENDMLIHAERARQELARETLE